MKKVDIRRVVRNGYARIAKSGSLCCAPVDSCCVSADAARDLSIRIGYSRKDLESVPEGANLGLGCGNPVALASLREGETVLDLGCGAGFDCFLAANMVGKSGMVIGVDMTPEMIEKARDDAKKGNYGNVEFRLGEIENIPIANRSVDVVISNCVINLSPDKRRVFEEAFRVLKPGGRLMISDIVLLKKLSDSVKNSVEAYIGCISGAAMRDEYLEAIRSAGFHDVKIIEEKDFPIESMVDDPTVKAIIDDLKIQAEDIKAVANSILSVYVHGLKSKETAC